MSAGFNEVFNAIEGMNRDIDRLVKDRDAALRRAERAEEAAKKNLQAALAWNAQAIGNALGMALGTDVPGSVVPAIEALKARLAEAEAATGALGRLLDEHRRDCSWRVRAEKAEAEVARLKALLRLDVKNGDSAVFNSPDGPVRITFKVERAAAGLPPEPSESAVAAEATAKPAVLPEHLALLEAYAAWNLTSHSPGVFDHEKNIEAKSRALSASKALVAAVARRDGGGK